MNITMATRIGKRTSQEDRFLVYRQPNKGVLLAVMDGHGGDAVASLVRENIKRLWHGRSTFPDGKYPEHALAHIGCCLSEMVRILNLRGGSTLSIVWIPRSRHYVSVAVLGDSPVIVRNAKGNLWVSPEHNVRANHKEREEAEKRGGVVKSIFGGEYLMSPTDIGLQLTRSVGDWEMGNVVNRCPETARIPLFGGIVVLCTDGITSSGRGESLSPELILTLAEEGGAEALVKNSEQRGVRDNATAIVVKV